MLLLGIAHIHVDSRVPNYGYWQSFIVVVIIGAIGGALGITSILNKLREID